MPTVSASPRDRRPSRATLYVSYEVCVSVVFATFVHTTRPIPIGVRDHRVIRGLPYSLLSLLFGPWGLPWGPILTLRAIYHNLLGGTVVTPDSPPQS